MLSLAPSMILLSVLTANLNQLEAREGISDSVAYASNGRIALGLAGDGRLSSLRWPGPGGPDHVHYQTALRDAQTPSASLSHGLSPNMGLFLGLSGGAMGPRPRWLAETLPAPTIQPLTAGASTLRVKQNIGQLVGQGADEVQCAIEYRLIPDQALLMIRIELVAQQASALPEQLWLFANLAPRSAQARSDSSDWRDDDQNPGNDFAALFSAEADALLHFRPRAPDRYREEFAQDFALLSNDDASQERAEALLESLLQNSLAGVFWAIGADQPSLSHQVGRFDPLDQARPQDAYFDALDGQLRKHVGVMGQVDAALRWPFSTPRPDATGSSVQRKLTLFVSVADTANLALDLLENARLRGFDMLESQVYSAETSWTRAIASPDDDDTMVQALARDSLRRVDAAQDPNSGALIAAVDAQPGLALDCPALSALMAVALDQGGFPQAASAHAQFLAQVQSGADAAVPGAWQSCYTHDGQASAQASADGIHPAAFSLDASALSLWSWASHLQSLRKAGLGSQADRLAESLAPAALLASQTLLACDDANTGLSCAAALGWGEPLRQDLGAAIFLRMGLKAASELLNEQDNQAELIALLDARYDALGVAIWSHFADPEVLLRGDPTSQVWALLDAALWTDHPSERGTVFNQCLEQLDDVINGRDSDAAGSWQADWPLRLWALAQVSQDPNLDLDPAIQDQLRQLLQVIAYSKQSLGLSPGALWTNSSAAQQDPPLDPSVQSTLTANDSRLGRPFAPTSAALLNTTLALYGRRPPPVEQGPIDGCSCSAPATLRGGLFLSLGIALALAWRRRSRRGQA